LFVLILDNLEDTIVNLGDIENRLALKVLAVLPHVRRKKRQQVARFAVDEKYSQFSEAVAGLRNLLDSPRYDALSHCLLVISTMPGEGKTITSSSLAITYAQAGKKTLHVDFDMRRPRLAKIWNLELTNETSFSNVMQEASEKHKPDFEKLINRTEVDNLHVIASLDPDGVSPSQILGSSAVADFFDWARSNYDRVIIDSPPYGIVGDVVSLAVAVDSVIIMCCPDRTHFKPIRHCARTLTEAGANILGVVVNDVDYSNIGAFSVTHSHSYRKYGYGSYYYGYGYGGKRRSGKAAEDSDNDSPTENEGKSEYTDEE
jgi:capsular exopolysaccharide synthesis family protein